MTAGALHSIADAVLAVVLAPSCAACGALLEEPTRGPVCARCWSSIRPLTPPLCAVCGDALPSWRAADPAAQCPRCRRMPRAIARARSLGVYDGSLRAILHALKYDGRRSLARRLGRMMREQAADLLDGVICAVPVPLHGSRRRERGFNQAADLARALDLPVAHALRRVRATVPQAGLPAARRHGNVRGAFAATRACDALRHAVVLVVDDVSTTGATLDACARALRAAGVKEVRAITAARAVTSPR